MQRTIKRLLAELAVDHRGSPASVLITIIIAMRGKNIALLACRQSVPSVRVGLASSSRETRHTSTSSITLRSYYHTSRVLRYASEAKPDAQATERKKRLVILGSGWGAMSLLKGLDQVSTVKIDRLCIRSLCSRCAS